MKIQNKLFSLFLASLVFAQCNGQTTNSLLADAAKALGQGTSVSTILTDPNYMSLHPDKEFRELIKKYADTSAVNISPADEPGKKIRIIVSVKNDSGEPVKNALVYFYQTDAKGWYAARSPHVGGNEGDMRQARLFGYGRTGEAGQLEIHTIKPSGYPQSDLPAHIHIHFERDGYRSYVTELLFDDDERLIGNVREQSIRYQFQISKPEQAPAGFDQQFSYSVTFNK